MFVHNSVDATNGRSMTKTKECKYPVYKLNSDGTQSLYQYNKPKPKHYNKKQLVVAITKSFTETSVIVDNKDYDAAHVSVDVDNETQVDNIKSFIFSEACREHVAKWKEVDGYGYNYGILYLPVFDKNKSWTNDEVKAFLESFIDQ